MKARRTRGREIALQALYAQDVHEDYGWDIAEQTVREAEAPDDVRAFAQTLVDGVRARQVEIDRMLEAATDNWELERLACVDRNVLRLAVHELSDRDDIPARVTINEAIELGKRFSTARSGAFINGVLDRVRSDLGLPAVTIDVSLDDEPARSIAFGGDPAADDATGDTHDDDASVDATADAADDPDASAATPHADDAPDSDAQAGDPTAGPHDDTARGPDARLGT